MATYEDVFDAAESSDEAAVRNYIEQQNVPVDSINKHEITIAHIAARKGSLNIVKYALEKAPSILARANGNEVLLLAVKYGHLDIVKYLVEHWKMSIEKRFSNRYYGNTAIHFAAQYEELEVLKYFLEDRKGDVNVLNDVDQTPIFEALLNRDLRMTKYLIEERGADVYRLDYMRESIVDKAANYDDYNTLRYLIHERKMKPSLKWKEEIIHRAASFDHQDLVKFLVEELHVDVNTADEWGKTPLHKAAMDNNYNISKYLLDHGANANLKDQDGLLPWQESEDENVTALLSNTTGTRNRRSVFEPVHLPEWTIGTPGDIRRDCWQRLGADMADATETINTFQNFLLMVGAIFKNSSRNALLVKQSYTHSAHLALDSALRDRSFEGV